MSFRKRLNTFVSNWLGVIIAAVIVIVSSTFGGVYLYGRSKIDNAINFTTQAITLLPINGLTQSGTTDSPRGYIYHIVTLDTYTLPISKDGSWDKTAQTGYQYFEGFITIDEQTFAALVTKGSVDVFIKGTISGSGHYKWIKRQGQRPFTIPLPGVLFRFTNSNA